MRRWIAEASRPDLPRHLGRRARRLLALPVVGTGAGGSYHEAGEVLGELLPALDEEAARHGVGIALVTASAPHHAAAQQARRERLAGGWDDLTPALRERAETLAALASQGRLVLFIGAGISVGAGLPTWGELLRELAQRAGVPASDTSRLEQLGELDRAEYLAQRLGGREAVAAVVVELITRWRRPGLAHALLAGLPFAEAVTTNYDRLFEGACGAAGHPVAVLPYEPARGSSWLLKMHGCVAHPEDIVLTRRSYLRYAESNAALAGIVQAMLITRHMLFLGFSLSDENFLRIVDQVRRAAGRGEGAGPAEGRLLGSAVMLRRDALLQDLWQGEIDWVCVDDGNAGVTVAEAARRLEIFLDYLAFRARTPAFLLDHRFEALQTPADRSLAALLRPLVEAPAEARASGAWPLVEALLGRLGAKGAGTRRER